MQIEGLRIDDMVAGEVELPRPGGKAIVLRVRAMPLGAEERMARHFSPPPPPRDYAMKKGLILRDREGKPIYEENLSDPDWLAQAAKATRLMMAYVAFQGLKADPRVRFDVEPALEERDPRAFYEKVAEEMAASGFFVAGDLRRIFQRVMELSNFDKAKLDGARDGFFDQAEPGR